jgi:hypothetical protein
MIRRISEILLRAPKSSQAIVLAQVRGIRCPPVWDAYDEPKVPDINLVVPFRPKDDLRGAEHLRLYPLREMTGEPTRYKDC